MHSTPFAACHVFLAMSAPAFPSPLLSPAFGSHRLGACWWVLVPAEAPLRRHHLNLEPCPVQAPEPGSGMIWPLE